MEGTGDRRAVDEMNINPFCSLNSERRGRRSLRTYPSFRRFVELKLIVAATGVWGLCGLNGFQRSDEGVAPYEIEVFGGVAPYKDIGIVQLKTNPFCRNDIRSGCAV